MSCIPINGSVATYPASDTDFVQTKEQRDLLAELSSEGAVLVAASGNARVSLLLSFDDLCA